MAPLDDPHRPSGPARAEPIVLVSPSPDPIRTLPVLRTLEADITVLGPEAAVRAALTGRLVIVDVRRGAKPVLDDLGRTSSGRPAVVVALTDAAGLATVDRGWPVDDLILDTASRVELVARLRLRQPGAHLDEGTSGSGLGASSVGPLTIDQVQHRVTVEGRQVELTFREFQLLAYLVDHQGQVVTREELLRTVWQRPAHDVGYRTVDVHVARLRRKIGPVHSDLVHTVRKVGYRLALPATEATAA